MGVDESKVNVSGLPEGWTQRPLFDLVRPATGQVSPRHEPYASMTLVAPDHIESETGRLIAKRSAVDQGAISGKYLFKPGDVVYSKIRPYLRKAFLADFDGLCSADMYPLSPRGETDSGFLLATLLGHAFSVFAESASARSGIPKINRDELAEFSVAAPPPAEQRAIAAALSDVDALLAKLDQLITKKRDLKQAVLQQLLSGRIRLHGFVGAWEERPFAKVLSRVNAKRHQIQTSEYLEVGAFPVVDQGQKPVVAYSDRSDKVFKCPSGGVIVFGDHTCIIKYVDFDFVVGADGTQLLSAKPGVLARYVAYQLENSGVESTGYNRHFKFLAARSFSLPGFNEQEAIVGVLADMDAEIAALEARSNKTRQLKQGMMQALLTGRIRLV